MTQLNNEFLQKKRTSNNMENDFQIMITPPDGEPQTKEEFQKNNIELWKNSVIITLRFY